MKNFFANTSAKNNFIFSVIVSAVVIFTLVFTLTYTPKSDVQGNPTTSVETPASVEGTIEVQNSAGSETSLNMQMVNDYQYAVVSVMIMSSENQQVSMGSGVAIYAGGYITTNWHVVSSYISNPSEYSIKVKVYEGLGDGEGVFTDYNAKLLWSNINFDLAVIKCDKTNLPYVKMSNRWINLSDSTNRLKIAENVWTLGSPYDISLQGTFTKGTIASELERVSSSSSRIYESLIQHNASISNGSSGSGLFDYQGNLIGLNTLGVTSTSSTAANDIYFATPIYPVYNIISKIVALEEDNNETTAYKFPTIGVTGYDSKMAEYFSYDFSESGIYAEEVPSGPSTGKIKAGDVIVGLSISVANSENDEGYFKINKRNDLLYALSNFDVGDSIKLYVNRNSQTLSFEITLV